MNNKDLVLEFLNAIWGAHDLTAIDKMVYKEVIIRSPFDIKYGALTMREIIEKWLNAFPDLIIKFYDVIAEGDMVSCRWHAKGTHLGGFFETNPTHKEVSYDGATFFKIENSKIVEYWSIVDIHSILKQLEVYTSITEVID